MFNPINYALAKRRWDKAGEDIETLGDAGRNISTNSHFHKKNVGTWSAIYGNQVISGHILKKTLTSDASAARMEFRENLKKGVYTVTLNARTPNGYRIASWTNVINFTTAYVSASPTEFRTHSYTFEVENDGEVIMRFYYQTPIAVGDTFEIDWYKLEAGRKASKWTPAPEDIGTHPLVAEIAEVSYRAKYTETELADIRNAIVAMGGAI